METDQTAGIEIDTNQTPEVVETIKDTPAPAVETPDGEPEAEQSNEKPRRKGGYERKLDRATQELEALRQENERIKQENEKYRPKEAPKAPNDGEPKVEDFENTLDYIRAVNKYDAEQIAKQNLDGWQKDLIKQADQQKAAESYKAKEQKFVTEVEALTANNPHFDEIADQLADEGVFTPAIVYNIINSDMSVKLSEHFMNNPDELRALASMSQPQIERAITRLEGRLEVSNDQPVVAERTTKAPAPITPVKSKASTSTKRAEDMTQEEYEKGHPRWGKK